MKYALRLLTAAALLSLPSLADVDVFDPNNYGGQLVKQRIKPQAVPTSSTPVVSRDAYIDMLTVTNTTAGAITITVADRQSSPVALMTAVSIAANTTYVIGFPGGYLAVNGFTVVASGSGLNYFASWRQ